MSDNEANVSTVANATRSKTAAKSDTSSQQDQVQFEEIRQKAIQGNISIRAEIAVKSLSLTQIESLVIQLEQHLHAYKCATVQLQVLNK